MSQLFIHNPLDCARGYRLHHQETARRIGEEGGDDGDPGIEGGDHIGGPTVAEVDQDHLGRGAIQKAPLPEIVVLGDDTESMRSCAVPDGGVVRASEDHLSFARLAFVSTLALVIAACSA